MKYVATFFRDVVCFREVGLIWAGLIWAGLCLGNPAWTIAQVNLEEGEQVKVFVLGDWRDGVVVGRQGEKYGIQYEFANAAQQRLFDRQAIRMMCEIESLDFTRTWANESGQFKVDAALKRIQGDQVVLVKIDLNEITVPVASLSKKDVAYVAKFKKNFEAAIARGELPGEVPTLPEIETFSVGFGQSGLVAVGSEKMSPLGRLPSYLTSFSQTGCGFKLLRTRQELVAIIPAGGPEQLVLVSVREDNFFNQFYTSIPGAVLDLCKKRISLGAVFGD